MWSRFDRVNVPHDAFSRNESVNDIERISTIADSLASIGTERTETLVSLHFHRPLLPQDANVLFSFVSLPFQHIDERAYDTDHTDLNSEFDESEVRRELLKDVSFSFNIVLSA